MLEADGLKLMASDDQPDYPTSLGTNFSVFVAVRSEDDLRTVYAALRNKGSEITKLDDQGMGSSFGMVADRFGIQWMLALGI